MTYLERHFIVLYSVYETKGNNAIILSLENEFGNRTLANGIEIKRRLYIHSHVSPTFIFTTLPVFFQNAMEGFQII